MYKYVTDTEILEVIQEVVDKFLIPRFKELGMNASGEWIKSLEVELRSPNEAVIRGRFYSYWLARGRGANADQSPEALSRWAVWAGNTFIKEWVKAKGIAANPIAVAYNIAKKGTKSKRTRGTTLLEVLTEPATIKYVEDRIAKIVVPKLAERLIRDTSDLLNNP